jgi:hypothetical protein
MANTKRTSKLTAPLYTYVEPGNRTWVHKQAKKKDESYSSFINHLIARSRAHTEVTPIRGRKKTTSAKARAA